MKNIAILGSTGSIGTQTLDVARKNEDLRVVAVSAGKSVEKLEEQVPFSTDTNVLVRLSK